MTMADNNAKVDIGDDQMKQDTEYLENIEDAKDPRVGEASYGRNLIARFVTRTNPVVNTQAGSLTVVAIQNIQSAGGNLQGDIVPERYSLL
jgi:hypothetical protein